MIWQTAKSANVLKVLPQGKKKENNNSSSNNSGAYQYTNYNTSTNYNAPPPEPPNPQKKKRKKVNFDKFKTHKSYKTNTKEYKANTKNILSRLFLLVIEFFRSPVYTATKNNNLNKSDAILLVCIEGLFMSIAGFMSTRSIRGVFGLASNLLGFHGASGWATILQMIGVALGGVLIMILQFLALAGIFYLLDKFIIKRGLAFSEYITSFSVCSIPMIFIGLAGIILAIFSGTSFLMLTLASVIFEAILIYELLSTKWYGVSADRLIYTITSGFFIYLTIAYNLVKILF